MSEGIEILSSFTHPHGTKRLDKKTPNDFWGEKIQVLQKQHDGE